MISKPGILVVILVHSLSFVLNNCEDLLRHSIVLCSFIFSLKFALLYVLILWTRPHLGHFCVLYEQYTTLLLPFYQGDPTASQGCCILLHQVPKVSERPISRFHSGPLCCLHNQVCLHLPLSRISLTDCWTAGNGYKFMALDISFIHNCQLFVVTLDLIEMKASHIGQYLAQ